MATELKLNFTQRIGLEASRLAVNKLPSDSALLRWICQRWFLPFCMAVRPTYMKTRFHSLLAFELQKMYENVRDGIDQRAMVEVQPQIGKSTTCSELFPAWVLGKSHLDTKKGWPIICASYGSSLAEQKSQNCRDIVESEAYQMIFPGTRLRQDSTSKEYWRTTTGGSYKAIGVGGGLTGFEGKLLVCDDPFKDRADADSELIRENTWKWWDTVFTTRKQGITGMLLVNTRWHLDDVAGRLIAQQERAEASRLSLAEYDQWKRLNFPAFAVEDEFFYGKLFRKAGEVLCPERFSHSSMIKERNNKDPYEWSSLYMQNPVTKGTAKFKTEWWKYFDDADIKFKKLRTYTLVDPATKKKKSDNSVIRTIGKEMTTGYVFLLEETAGRLDPGETVDAIFHHVRTWRSRVWVESNAYQSTLVYWITEKQREEQMFFEVNELNSTKSKEDRIEGLIPLYKAGMIFHRKSDTLLEGELLVFPKGKNDDRADAVGMFLDVAEITAAPVTPEQKQQEREEAAEGFDPHASISSI